MKKTRYDLPATNRTTTTIIRSMEGINAAEKLTTEKLPTPPSEEMVARLNAIAREYPFCAYMKQNNLFLL